MCVYSIASSIVRGNYALDYVKEYPPRTVCIDNANNFTGIVSKFETIPETWVRITKVTPGGFLAYHVVNRGE